MNNWLAPLNKPSSPAQQNWQKGQPVSHKPFSQISKTNTQTRRQSTERGGEAEEKPGMLPSSGRPPVATSTLSAVNLPPGTSLPPCIFYKSTHTSSIQRSKELKRKSKCTKDTTILSAVKEHTETQVQRKCKVHRVRKVQWKVKSKKYKVQSVQTIHEIVCLSTMRA
jgi:hypothetical protein